jgi:small subunit ribosomal protein S1
MAQNKRQKTDNATEEKPSKSSSVPTTMEELLNQTGYSIHGFKRGDTLKGTITRVTPKEITINVGGKTDGVVIDRELETYKETLLALKPGDEVIAQVIVPENDRGQAVLSLRKSIFEKRWTELTDKQKSGEAVDVIARESIRGGLLVEYAGLRGYIPQSQLDGNFGRQTDRLSNRKITVKVVEVDEKTNRLIFSQRMLAEEANLTRQKALFSVIPVGESVDATVTGTVPFGAFAKFKVEKDGQSVDVEGLIHISEIAWEKVDDPSEYLKTGDVVKVKIVGVDEKTGKLTLSLKQLLPDPWESVTDMFEKDTQVKGTVSRVSPYGIFVTLSPGVDGLIHVSKIPPGEEPKAGDEVTVTIEDIQQEKRKISLSMSLTEKPIGYR